MVQVQGEVEVCRPSDTAASAARIGRECQAALTLANGKAALTSLATLSPTHLRLEGVPDDWEVGKTVGFHLGVGAAQVPFVGRIEWRQDDVVRIEFKNRGPAHERRVRWLLREILASWKQGFVH